jgi:hypothetical protein
MKKNTMVWRLAAVALSCVLALSACGGSKGGGSPEEKGAVALLSALNEGDAAAIGEALGGLNPEVLNALTSTSGSPGGDFSYDLNEAKDGIVIKKYSGEGGVVIIPAAIEDYPVTEILGGAFAGSREAMNLLGNYIFVEGVGDYITSVVIPASVKKIGGSAFTHCENLTTVILPDTLEEIGGSTFNSCSSLHTVNIPAGIKKIENSAFDGCGELYNLSIPDSVTAIDWGEVDKNWGERYEHFEGCQKLKLATRERLKNLGYEGEF